MEPRARQRPLFVLDLAVPRDFDPAIGDRPGVYLYPLDDLQQVCQRNRRERDRELPAAMKIIDQETERFFGELHHRAVGPIVQRLRQGWEGSQRSGNCGGYSTSCRSWTIARGAKSAALSSGW